MKIIITENQLGLIVENKATIDNLVKIVKLTQSDAELLYSVAGKLSMWLAKKIKDKRIQSKIEKITGIIDWIRTGLDNNIQSVKDVTFDELVDMQDRWHKSLTAKEYDFEYQDENITILDYRDDYGLGYYWVKLNNKPCFEENKRMGHCGTSEKGDLYSLRVNELKGQTGRVINKSLVTASIKDGVVYQMKGRFNKKPESIYHDYIAKLLLKKNSNGKYFVESFGSEYAPEEDFKITDFDFSKYADVVKKRIDLLISADEIERNNKRLESLEAGILFDDDDDCTQQAIYKFLVDDKGLEIRGDDETREYANVILKLQNANELSDNEFNDLIEKYLEYKENKFDFYDIKFEGNLFTIIDEGKTQFYKVLEEDDAKEQAIDSIADGYDGNVGEILKGKKHYLKFGIDVDSFIDFDVDSYIREMVSNNPESYLDTDDYTDDDVEDYINGLVGQYKNNVKSFIAEHGIDATEHFDLDAFAKAVFEIDKYSILAYYDGTWEEVYTCNKTYIIYRTD
jgi:hypothetical protein